MVVKAILRLICRLRGHVWRRATVKERLQAIAQNNEQQFRVCRRCGVQRSVRARGK